MDNILNTSEIADSYSAISTLIKALKNTIQINDIIKSKLLAEQNYFSNQQMKVIYENVDLLDDNSLILSQAIQAIKTLLSEVRNLKEIRGNQHYINTQENLQEYKYNSNQNNQNAKIINYDVNANYLDTDILNRYNLTCNSNNPNNNNNYYNANLINNSNNFSKSEDEIKILDGSIKTNLSNNYNYNTLHLDKVSNESAMKLNFDYTQIDNVNNGNNNYKKNLNSDAYNYKRITNQIQKNVNEIDKKEIERLYKNRKLGDYNYQKDKGFEDNKKNDLSYDEYEKQIYNNQSNLFNTFFSALRN